MAIPRVATALLAGRRRAAADIVFAGVRVHHHQGAARLLQPGNLAAARLWPPPTAFSYGGRVGSLGLGARRGMSGSSGGGGGRSSGGGIPGGDGKRRLEEWTRSVDSQLEEILTELQQLSAAQMNAVKVSTSSFQSLKRSMERTGKVTTAVISLSVTASVYLVLFALYCVGVKMAYIVDADEFAKKFAHSVLDDEEFKAKLDQTADRLGAIAVSAPFRKAQEWFFGKDSSPQDDLDLEASDTWEDWAVSFSFFALSLIRGMPVYESDTDELWMRLYQLGVRRNKENEELLNILVAVGLISKKKKGKLTTYALVEEQYRECIDAGFRPKIVPILKKGGCSNGTAKSRDEERRLQLEIRAKVEAARCRKQH
uniref:Uncharacterized protein n=1 Tax=Oryza sativa subsp. japonica TaxID=39947 RepID=Q7XIY6_ORYSJ|nr:hypothetical protein [Oryza sativa Japonica Group]BAD31911.1 hypothetical protein [Oryza sativa Japonica Group]